MVKPVYGIQAFPLTAKTVLSKGNIVIVSNRTIYVIGWILQSNVKGDMTYFLLVHYKCINNVCLRNPDVPAAKKSKSGKMYVRRM